MIIGGGLIIFHPLFSLNRQEDYWNDNSIRKVQFIVKNCSMIIYKMNLKQ